MYYTIDGKQVGVSFQSTPPCRERLGRGSSMDEAKRKQWAKCIIQGAMQIENSVTNEDIEWNINVLQMAINKMKAELVEP